MPRIVLADDHSLFREALRGLLETRLAEAEIVGEAATALEALDLCRQLQPEILVLDISMPELNGLDVLPQILQASQATRVIVVSQHCDRAYVIRALRLGAKGYVSKRAAAQDLVRALEAALQGGIYIDPSVADLVVEAALHPDDDEAAAELHVLTRREREVLQLVAAGRTAKEIAETLVISPFTVNRHRANFMDKLGLHSKAELLKLAIRLGLVAP